MCLFTKWVELIITQDSERFIKVRMLLQNAGIVYRENLQNIGHGNRRNGHIGALGENPSYANLYQIYVKKTDAQQAKAVISRNWNG